MPVPRIPSEADFAPLRPHLTVSLHFPSPRESVAAILVLFHGLGDSDAPFLAFARNLSLPGVLAIAVRGTGVLPPSLLGDDDDEDGVGGFSPATTNTANDNDDGGSRGAARRGHFHWGDDLNLATTTTTWGGGGEDAPGLDPDPGFERAAALVLDRLVRDTLVDGCGWRWSDVLLFGFGQGGSLALGLASRLRVYRHHPPEVRGAGVAAAAAAADALAVACPPPPPKAFKGVVSIGGALPASMIPSGGGGGARDKARTPVLVCHGRASEAFAEEEGAEGVDVLRREFADVRVVCWGRPDDDMPRNRAEALPMMEFFAERLRG